ncbi:MAG: alpha-ribazole phosphatase family protein [Pseudomonadota bacterium]
MALILLRHTAPKVEPGICYGQTDLDVTINFKREAMRALNSLPTVAHIITSPLRRCRILADFISQHLSLPVKEDPRFMEMDFGRWEGQAWSDIPRVEIDAWADDFFHARPHGGESVAQLKARTDAALADYHQSNAPTLIVTHAGVIRAAFAKGETAENFDTKIEFGAFAILPAQ